MRRRPDAGLSGLLHQKPLEGCNGREAEPGLR
jgi:hypothetical protein